MEKSTKKWAGWIALTVIVVAAGVALAVTNSLTEGPIAEGAADEANETLRALFPEADAFQPVEAEQGGRIAYRAVKGADTLGYAAVTTAQGYGGAIEITTGLDASGTLRGAGVGGADFKETEGLGAKAKEAAFTDQFKQKTPPVSLGDDIDAISGATITSRAVVDGVNNGAAMLATLLGGGAPQATQAAQATRAANVSVLGYGGPVLAQVTLDDTGAIASLAVGAERFMETEGVGSRVREESFTAQFVGKKPPLTLQDVDAVSGATVSSQAVVDAVNEAAAFLGEQP